MLPVPSVAFELPHFAHDMRVGCIYSKQSVELKVVNTFKEVFWNDNRN